MLAREQVPAVFCLVGVQVERHPDLVRRIVEDGHVLANHTYSHPHLSQLTAEAFLAAEPYPADRSAGFLVQPLDVLGLAVLASAGPRVAAVWKPAVGGACVGIAVRTLAHALLG